MWHLYSLWVSVLFSRLISVIVRHAGRPDRLQQERVISTNTEWELVMLEERDLKGKRERERWKPSHKYYGGKTSVKVFALIKPTRCSKIFSCVYGAVESGCLPASWPLAGKPACVTPILVVCSNEKREMSHTILPTDGFSAFLYHRLTRPWTQECSWKSERAMRLRYSAVSRSVYWSRAAQCIMVVHYGCRRFSNFWAKREYHIPHFCVFDNQFHLSAA